MVHLRPFSRYLLFQIPGWLLAAALLYWFWPRTGFDEWLGVGAFALWVGKDFAMWPLVRVGYDTHAPIGADELIGSMAIVQKELTPVGTVRVRGELWRARAEEEATCSSESAVEVVAVAGMTLVVRPSSPFGH